MYAFGASVELLRGFYMASVCFVYVCDVHHLDKRIYNQCPSIYQEWQGRQWARVPPPPLRAGHTKGYPQANFLFFIYG